LSSGVFEGTLDGFLQALLFLCNFDAPVLSPSHLLMKLQSVLLLSNKRKPSSTAFSFRHNPNAFRAMFDTDLDCATVVIKERKGIITTKTEPNKNSKSSSLIPFGSFFMCGVKSDPRKHHSSIPKHRSPSLRESIQTTKGSPLVVQPATISIGRGLCTRLSHTRFAGAAKGDCKGCW